MQLVFLRSFTKTLNCPTATSVVNSTDTSSVPAYHFEFIVITAQLFEKRTDSAVKNKWLNSLTFADNKSETNFKENIMHI